MQSYSMCLPTTIDGNSSKLLNNNECLLLDSHLFVSFLHSHPFPCFLYLFFPHLSDLTSFPALLSVLGKKTLERDQAVCRLPRNASQCPGLDLTFIYALPKPLHHNPCCFWYQDSFSGSKSRKASVDGWVQVTPTSVPSCWKAWRCSWISAGSGNDIPSPGRCPLGHNPTVQLQVLSALLYLLPSLQRSRLCTNTLCVFRKPH